MDFSAPYAGYVIACYAVSGLSLGGLLVAILARSRRVQQRLETLETEGAPRRPRGLASPA
ncbi:MAG: heme exporter protein CcmD [Parvibaculaceae bacterium]